MRIVFRYTHTHTHTHTHTTTLVYHHQPNHRNVTCPLHLPQPSSDTDSATMKTTTMEPAHDCPATLRQAQPLSSYDVRSAHSCPCLPSRRPLSSMSVRAQSRASPSQNDQNKAGPCRNKRPRARLLRKLQSLAAKVPRKGEAELAIEMHPAYRNNCINHLACLPNVHSVNEFTVVVGFTPGSVHLVRSLSRLNH